MRDIVLTLAATPSFHPLYGIRTLLGARMHALNTGGAVIGNKLDSQIFELRQPASWRTKIHQISSLRRSQNFFPFNIHPTTCAYELPLGGFNRKIRDQAR